VQSRIDLPQRSNGASIDVVFLAASPPIEAPQAPFHQWILPDQTIWSQFFRLPGGYLIRFPALADFEVSSAGDRVTCRPHEGVSEGTVQHLYLNQIVPLALSRSGRLMFHASAVDIGPCAVAFLGASGQGKSTLAASFATAGMPFLTDDGLSIERESQKCFASPSHPSVRLWDDSREALLGADIAQAPPVQFTNKARFLAGDSLRFCSERREIRRFYVLGPGTAREPIIETLVPSAALIHLVKNSFLLDVDVQEAIARHFDELTSLVELPIFFGLDYPRTFGRLATVRNAVLTHANA
jgi:hypothetical protein